MNRGTISFLLTKGKKRKKGHPFFQVEKLWGPIRLKSEESPLFSGLARCTKERNQVLRFSGKIITRHSFPEFSLR